MTALRSLLIQLGLDDAVSNKLRGIDSQLNGIESKVVDTQTEFDELGQVTTEYGRVAGNEIEDVSRDVTKLNEQVERHADVTKRTTDKVAKDWAAIGIAIGGAAVATEVYLRSQQDLYFTADKIAYITGMNRQEVIDLATELTNLSFSLEDAYGVMEAGARQGLRTREELAEYAQFWDMVGTAAEEDATNLARRSVALQSVGIEARDLAETMDTLGFVMTHTSLEIGQYLNLVGDMAKRMDEYNLTIEDTAVILAALEERGLRGEKSTQVLGSAMNKAKGDTRALYRELGITEDQVAQLSKEIEGSADYIIAMGDAYNETRTTLQWFQTEIGKLAHALGVDLTPLLGAASAMMSGLSTVILTTTGAVYLYTTAITLGLVPSLTAATTSVWAFTAALLANPITWIVVAIVGLVAALWYLSKNWDRVSEWFIAKWEKVSEVVGGALDWIGNAWDKTVGYLVSGITWLKETITEKFSGILDAIIKYNPFAIITRQWKKIIDYLQSIDLIETGKEIIRGLLSGVLDIGSRVVDAVKGIGESIVEGFKSFFKISSPSKLTEEMGIAVGEGFKLGLEKSLPESISPPGISPTEQELTYNTRVITPTVETYTSVIRYENEIPEPNISPLEEELTYNTRVITPTIEEPKPLDFEGGLSYSVEVIEPELETSSIPEKFREIIDQIAKYHPLNIITKQWTEVIEYLKGIDLKDSGQNIISSLAEGISETSKVLFDTIKGIGESIVSGITEFFEISSPSRLMQEIGSSIGEGFNLGINESIPKKITLPEFESISFEDSEPYEVTTEDISLTQKYVPEKETFRSSETNYNTFAPSTVINVTASNGDADAIATTIDRRIRQTFDQHAETYFARQRRRRSSTV